MPYKRMGNKVFVKRGGRWVLKSACESAVAAEKQLNLLRGVEHGWKPTGKRGGK